MTYQDAFALFDRLGMPAPVGNETFIMKVAEHIQALESLTELRFDTIPRPHAGDIILIKSDDITESMVQMLRTRLRQKLAPVEVLCCDTDSDISKITSPKPGETLVFRTDDMLSEETIARMKEKFPGVTLLCISSDTEIEIRPPGCTPQELEARERQAHADEMNAGADEPRDEL